MTVRKVSLATLAFFVCSTAAAVPGVPVVAADPATPQCRTLVKECMAHSDLERANCFYSAGTHPFCEGTDLGELILHRWEMAPNRPAGHESAPGFMGPQLVNRDCLKRFDALLSSKLVEDTAMQPTIEHLSESLEACYETMPMDLVRP